jgi:ATP-dependent RNA helicase HrpA
MPDARIEELKTPLPQCLLPDWVRLGSRLVRLLRDHHHPSSHDAILNRLLAQARDSAALREQRRLRVPQVAYPPDLPITGWRRDILAAIRAHQVVVIAGETGSGKTTQIPKMCLEAGLGVEAKIGCTQPRRVAAVSISQRIAEELKVAWGREVGCKIRFDDRSSPETYIKLMTDGILLAETQGDPLLSEYNALIIDEAHERSLNIDFLLGHLKGLLARRADLKLIITSATIDTGTFSQAFHNAPVLEVSGRLYPVEVVYAPFDTASEESGDLTYVDAAVNAATQVVLEPGGGDILIFMPGERDIRETRDLLEGRIGNEADIIPLFGRLSAGEQQRVFAPASRRKIVVATNIAETSLTIPGIRYVIDTGLARLSRYNPRTRIKRLPVEPISQSSARQRQGRCGRVRNGVCIRLYAEDDFAERPAYTQPEIQRANLAEVILRMIAFRLGDMETFPFINPPAPAAIASGYKLLQKLGALDENRTLTPLGADLARLPIDPILGRMLLQSQREHATRELLIIASGLSIQDPRERPLEQKESAAAAHKRFLDPRSDFLTLLSIWNAFHDQWETLRTQNQRRKFCKAHFLSYNRMREWQDLHAQLLDALGELGILRLNESSASYDAIHRSILTGLLSHVASKSDRNVYKAVGNRQVFIFPGSALFDRSEKPKKTGLPSAGSARPKPASSRQPPWIMAGEIVETSQLFARTVAGIDPQWIAELAPHLCRFAYHNPHWSASAGRVLVQETVTLHGLEVRRRQVAYGNINPKEATEIFIRSALVEENLLSEFPEEPVRAQPTSGSSPPSRQRSLPPASSPKELPARYGFLEHNRRVRQKVETCQTRVRCHELPDLDQALFGFYAQRLETVSSLEELNRLLRNQSDPQFLRLGESDLTGGLRLDIDADSFPDTVPLGGQPVGLSYAYAPGEDHDGVTVKLPLALAQALSPADVEWAVPGLRKEQIAEWLRSLPKALRRELMPFPPKVDEIARNFRPSGRSLTRDLARFIHDRFGVQISPSAWKSDPLPRHLRPRIEIVGPDGKTLGAGRDLEDLRQGLQKIETKDESPDWTRVAQQWERFDLTGWTFGDLPARVLVGENAELPLYAWPGLQAEEGKVSVRLFHSQEAARRASLAGVQRLVERAVQKDLAWLERDLGELRRFEVLYATLGPSGELQSTAMENLKRYLLPEVPFPALTEVHFEAAVNQARERLRGLASQLIEQVGAILEWRQKLLLRCGSTVPAAGGRRPVLSDLKSIPLGGTAVPAAVEIASGAATLANDLEALLPKRFLEVIPFEQLRHIPRYLKAMLVRAERAAWSPLKDQERARRLAPYRAALRQFQSANLESYSARRSVQEFRWMIEEFKVSIFAQELGTAFPISAKRLDERLEQIRREAEA